MFTSTFDLLLEKLIGHSDQFIAFFSSHSDRTFNVAGELFTILRSDKIYVLFISIEGVNILAIFYYSGECTLVCTRLKSTSDVLVFHKGGIVIEGVLQGDFFYSSVTL